MTDFDFPVSTDTPGGPDELDTALIEAMAAGAAAITASLKAAGVEGLGEHVGAIIALTVLAGDKQRGSTAMAGKGLEGFNSDKLFNGLAEQCLADVSGGTVMTFTAGRAPAPGGVDPSMN